MAFEVSDRDLAVLSALASFFPEPMLEEGASLVVFPSNKALCQRAHGMAESTLRRHLAALVRAGLVLRQDSPNGKRYARRGAGGELEAAFGFDLRPLLMRAPEIMEAAEAARDAAAALKSCRERVVLMMRDAGKLIAYGREEAVGEANWDALEDSLRLSQRKLRRRLDLEQLEELETDISATLETVTGAISAIVSEEMSGNGSNNERHYHNSKPHTLESEPSLEKPEGEGQGGKIPLVLVRKACPDLELYGTGEIRHWEDVIALADKVRPMIGISLDAWKEACVLMGPCDAAVSVGFILERIDEIKSPGGYLRALARKAGQGAFSTGPMVMSLLNRTERQAA